MKTTLYASLSGQRTIILARNLTKLADERRMKPTFVYFVWRKSVFTDLFVVIQHVQGVVQFSRFYLEIACRDFPHHRNLPDLRRSL